MRSRTEMVTTTFVDSEEDYSDEDDSEEDWRPSASNKNGKKQKQQKGNGRGTAKKGRKRKGPSVTSNKNSKRKPAYDESDDSEEDEHSEDYYEYDDCNTGSGSSKKNELSLSSRKQFSDKSSSNSESSCEVGDIFNLLIYVEDLISSDPHFNNRLCLWRKDSNNLLQKYIRVKTAPDQFLFTSSSVYSSLDDKRISDFYDVKVKSIDSAYRRVQILNPSDLHNITKKCLQHKRRNNENDDHLGDKKTKCTNTKNNLTTMYESSQYHIEQNDIDEENEEEEDCNVKGNDDEDIEEDDDD